MLDDVKDYSDFLQGITRALNAWSFAIRTA